MVEWPKREEMSRVSGGIPLLGGGDPFPPRKDIIGIIERVTFFRNHLEESLIIVSSLLSTGCVFRIGFLPPSVFERVSRKKAREARKTSFLRSFFCHRPIHEVILQHSPLNETFLPNLLREREIGVFAPDFVEMAEKNSQTFRIIL
jgi:hypothetical protein